MGRIHLRSFRFTRYAYRMKHVTQYEAVEWHVVDLGRRKKVGESPFLAYVKGKDGGKALAHGHTTSTVRMWGGIGRIGGGFVCAGGQYRCRGHGKDALLSFGLFKAGGWGDVRLVVV